MIFGKPILPNRHPLPVICAFFLLLSACHSAPEPDHIVMHRREDIPVNFRYIDTAISLLRDGDILLRTGADATSYMLRQMNLNDKTYSHCGIVMVENGSPVVYHSIGGEDNPAEKLRRDAIADFVSPVTNLRIGIARLDISAANIEKLHEIVARYYARGNLFDMDFDLTTDDKLYCAEFVYKAVQEAVSDTAYFELTHLFNRTYVGVDNLYRSPHVKMICDYQYK